MCGVCVFIRLCSSYPQKLLVPIWITDKELESVASFRSWKRIPVVVYRLVYLLEAFGNLHLYWCFLMIVDDVLDTRGTGR